MEESLKSVDSPNDSAHTGTLPRTERRGGTLRHGADAKEQSPRAFLPSELTSRCPDRLRKSTEVPEKLLARILRPVKPGPGEEGQSRAV